MPNPGYRETPLTDDEIKLMRELRASDTRKYSLRKLAVMFKTTTANAHLIVTGQTHKQAGGPLSKVKFPTTDEEVIEIRTLRAIGYSYSALSKEFGKTEVALRSICSGKSFPNVGGPLTGRNKR